MTEHRPTDRGFTLIEVVVVTALFGLIAVVVAATFVVIIKTTPAAEARTDDSRSLLGLTNYLPLDVSSTRGTDIVFPGSATSCGVTTGQSLLSLAWTDAAPPGLQTEINYRFVDDSGWRIVRFGCIDGVQSSSVRLTSALFESGPIPSPVPVDVVEILGDHDKDGGAVTPVQRTGVALEITTLAGSTQRIDSISDNLLETLAPVAVTSSTSSTIVPPSNHSPIAIDKALDAWPSQSVIVNLPASDPDGDPLVGSIDPANPLPPLWSASFTNLEMTLTPDPAAVVGTTYTFGYRATDPFGAMDSALVQVTIVATGGTTTTSTTTTTTTTTTTVPCSVPTIGINRSSISNGVHEDLATLKQDFTVTITKSGSCPNLVLSFVPDANTGTVYTRAFSGGTQVTVNKADYSWSDGVHALRVLNGIAGPQLNSINLTVT